jgi:DNA-binding PadR family transcriptional regulator
LSLKHAILGFLSYKPLSGYGLKKAFDRSVHHFWPADQSQIYRELSGLHEAGLVERELIELEDRLDKKLYHITDLGKAELQDWLTAPQPPRDSREPFLIQLYFGGTMSDEELLGLLEYEIQTVRDRLDEYEAKYQDHAETAESKEDPKANFLSVLTLEFGLFGDRFLLDWLQSVAQRVSAGEYSLRPL